MDKLEQKEPFNPTMAIARYRELEALLNLELINNPEWQERRARGDTSFLLDSRYFAEQNRLMEEADLVNDIRSEQVLPADVSTCPPM